MPIDYNSDDSKMFNLYKESDGRLSTGMDQFTPKLKRRGNPNIRLSYASYFEEEDTTLEIGTQAIYQPSGETVNIVDFNDKLGTATIELPDETRVYNVSASELDQSV